eukprot:SAG11_NODE_7_length_31267_cov_19.541966_28_plen_72_part_00
MKKSARQLLSRPLTSVDIMRFELLMSSSTRTTPVTMSRVDPYMSWPRRPLFCAGAGAAGFIIAEEAVHAAD